jgi:ectoine hydroxylase-related dioxygenase (phytanoyl-CoA dioxygenase family)
MQVLPNTHTTQLDHLESQDSNNLGQYIPDTLLHQHHGAREDIELQPGEVSLHSWQCVHSSGPNTTNQDRVGLAIRYITDEVENTKMVARERATLVCGSAGYRGPGEGACQELWQQGEGGTQGEHGEGEEELF